MVVVGRDDRIGGSIWKFPVAVRNLRHSEMLLEVRVLLSEPDPKFALLVSRFEMSTSVIYSMLDMESRPDLTASTMR